MKIFATPYILDNKHELIDSGIVGIVKGMMR